MPRAKGENNLVMLQARVDKPMKDWLESESASRSITVSALVRRLLAASQTTYIIANQRRARYEPT